ncbi:endonuclease/exonuclease/phosphatase family protein [Winogradskyella sp.]|uniref:endonuclease/exonuclease/phosphatase family protein n=1 Tax=Winogradskyella sp. TaxID=1883156 RepID=UPI003F6CF25E
MKKQLLLSLIVLVLGVRYINSLYKFSSSKHIEESTNISVMNYNVRLYNLYNWSPSKTIKDDILKFVNREQPDVLCVQESPKRYGLSLDGYYKYNAVYDDYVVRGQVIYTKFPIVASGSLDFPDSYNNAIYVDVVKSKDTVRVYNIHLQSSGINTEVEALKKESSENLLKRLTTTFKKQQVQTEMFVKHKNECKHRVIVAGDFNNTAYSYVYKEIKGDLVDTFQEAGNGFGCTFDFKFFPVRIDFILADESITVNGFDNYDVKYSDHYPIKATLNLH